MSVESHIAYNAVDWWNLWLNCLAWPSRFDVLIDGFLIVLTVFIKRVCVTMIEILQPINLGQSTGSEKILQEKCISD